MNKGGNRGVDSFLWSSLSEICVEKEPAVNSDTINELNRFSWIVCEKTMRYSAME